MHEKGKMVLTPNQHKGGLSEGYVLDFGGRITADDLFADKMESRGYDGSTYATVTLDHGSDWNDIYIYISGPDFEHHRGHQGLAALCKSDR